MVEVAELMAEAAFEKAADCDRFTVGDFEVRENLEGVCDGVAEIEDFSKSLFLRVFADYPVLEGHRMLDQRPPVLRLKFPPLKFPPHCCVGDQAVLYNLRKSGP